MSVRNLDGLFRPKSIAVIGASDRPRHLGSLVFRNLIEADFEGPVFPVNPHHDQIGGHTCFPNVNSLSSAPDLAVICTPAPTVPGEIESLAHLGTRAAIVLSAGLEAVGSDGRTLQQQMLDAARPTVFRIVGPNCLGVQVSGAKLNASFAHIRAKPGALAFVSQSGALCTAVLDWATSRDIGFSHMISLGNSADVDLGDVLDYLALDATCTSIVLYVEAVTSARKFMSAARAAARVKPVMVIKGGRFAAGARAARSHTGAMAGADDVYDAAFRRAGMLRIHEIDNLFDVIDTLSHVRQASNDNPVILTNGGGPGVLAADAIVGAGGHLAQLTQETIDRLDQALPVSWSHNNPVDIIGDADPSRFQAAATIVSNAPECGAILFTYAPTAVADASEIARATVVPLTASRKPVFASWLGGASVEEARRIFERAGIATYETPERAARAFLNLLEYSRNQAALRETPKIATEASRPDRARAQAIIAAALEDDRALLSEPESKEILEAYGIPIVTTKVAASPDEVAAEAERIGFPVALKVLSPEVSHKSEVGGVSLNLSSKAEVVAAAETMARQLAKLRPDAHLIGYSVQQMIVRPGAFELIVGCATDPTFGPVLLFGQGGTSAEIVKDRVVGLPPLNDVLAHDMIQRTRIARLFAPYRGKPGADTDAIVDVLVKLSQLIADIDDIAELDINPLLVDAQGAVALDARISVTRSSLANPHDRLAILPYPQHLEETVGLGGETVRIRPIRPEDELAHAKLLETVDREDLRMRFFIYRKSFSHDDLARLTQIDYDREMAFIASLKQKNGTSRTIGVVRSISDPDNIKAEFALLVDSAFKRRGLGSLLMRKLIAYHRARQTQALVGEILAENDAMLGLVRGLGFRTTTTEHDVVSVRLDLTSAASDRRN